MVQVGDPFTEKLLLEASLELIASGHIVAIQDMGAAGLTSSSAEMAARGDVGVSIDTSKVPVREEGMSPYEILLSESQERMLVVAKKGHEAQVRAILEKWDLSAAVIGEVIAQPVYRVTEGDRVVAEFPGSQLVSDCPMYNPPAKEDPAVAELRARDVHAIAELPEEKNPHVDARAPALLADDREQAMGLSPVRLHRAHQHRAASRRRRCGRDSPAPHRSRDRAQDRLQRSLRVARSPCGGAARRGRSGAQRRVHGRTADGDHELPQFRQSEASRGLLPVQGGGARHGRSLRGAWHAGHGRQRFVLQ